VESRPFSSIEMGTLEGFPTPPAMGSAGVNPSAPDAIDRLRAGARAALVLATSYFLVATSSPGPTPPQSCVHPTERLMVAVSGGCGPAGTIMLETLENECGITVYGATPVDLPSAGRFADFGGTRTVSLETSSWTLSGYLAASGGGGDAGVASDAGGGSDGGVGPGADAGDASSAGDGAASDGPIYVPPPAGSSFTTPTLRTCKAVPVPKTPLTLDCSDDGIAACTANLDL